MKPKRIIEENHHHWHLDMMIRELFKWFIIFLIVANVINLILGETNKDQNMYSDCLDACTEKPFYWNQHPEVINAGDRVECIRVCNSFHYSLTK